MNDREYAALWHRLEGTIILRGPGIRRGVRLERASVFDVAPTILALLDLPVPLDMEGRVLWDAMTDGEERRGKGNRDRCA